MNGSLRSSPSVVHIKLKRGPAGLGFNIVGGVDQQYVMNDSGIYVSKIKTDGAAALDGRLQEGDRILAINGVKLEDLTHRAAVELFRTAGEHVDLHVQTKLPGYMNGPVGAQPKHQSSFSFLGNVAAFVGVAAFLSLIYMKYIRKH
ncbi:Synaptojanin-2-binding protein Mitochondrial outer membrane protein 25 [Channa argus]|uniref:Synaptojanin-2-binding protein n=1 Tax=Channa argus TaxID=215402 RepID=A0A6G1QES1_CHAAH|nr:Synaptojanin-2-binding protein Mitochondrial outer membrane protein 25 [Channa argus]KAK2892120.1 hypothetical protein Q8A73_017785 [Channa argus]